MYDNDFNSQNSGNDSGYYPPPRRKGGGAMAKFGKVVMSLVLVACISAASVSGYIWYTGGGETPLQTSGNLTAPPTETAPLGTKTNYVLGTTVEALTTPEIFVKASPWVVAISTTVQVPNPYGGMFGQGVPGTGTSSGTGIIMNADGYILTNHHVIEDAVSVMVTTSGGNEYEAVIVGSDEKTDIAVLKIAAVGLSAAEFGESAQLVVGEPAIVIGNPLGTELADTLTQGVISSPERQVQFYDNAGNPFYMTLVQTDAAVSPGNSGGPLINSRGQVVGVINSKISAEGVEGIGFAVPSDIALSIAHDLIENGTVTIRPTLGISVYAHSEAQAHQYNEYYKSEIESGLRAKARPGIIVDSVTPGSAADNGGLKAGDEIIAFNGVKVTTSAELNYEKEKCKIGDTAVITVIRDGQQLDVSVTFVGGIAT